MDKNNPKNKLDNKISDNVPPSNYSLVNHSTNSNWHENTSLVTKDHNDERESIAEDSRLSEIVKYDAKSEEQQHSNISHQPYQSAHPPQQLQTIPGQSPLSTMAQSFPTYPYNVNEQYSMDANQRSYSMMHPFNMYAAMGPQWSGNQIDGMGIQSGDKQTTASIPVASNMEMPPSTSATNPYDYMLMANYIYGMMGNYCPYPMNPQENMIIPPVVKEIIKLSSCVLYPPHPGQHIKCRDRYPGCRTVFVGGLSEEITEEIIREIFSRCGEISTVRMSKKNFCHVRFAMQCYVDEAMKLSGYRLKIENKDESTHSGRLHVDYARARDDEYEHECLQRALQREARHRERMEQEALRPPTPPPVVHCSEHEANLLSDKLKSEEHFKTATHVLITWLERGECNRKTCGSFYSMIQCTNSHIKRLLNEKTKIQKKLTVSQTQLSQKMTSISIYFHEIFKIFKVMQESPNILENFSKTQRKEIEVMREKISEIIKAHSKELVEERVEDAMELSDDEDDQKPPEKPMETKKNNPKPKITKEEVQKLREQVEEIRRQYQAASEKGDSIQCEMDLGCKASTQILQEMQDRALAKQAKIVELQNFKDNYLASVSPIAEASHSHEITPNQVQLNSNEMIIIQHETRLISLIATFLTVHPRGASVDYICSYLIKVDPKVNARDIENLLQRFPKLFKECTSGIGCTLIKNWKYLGWHEKYPDNPLFKPSDLLRKKKISFKKTLKKK